MIERNKPENDIARNRRQFIRHPTDVPLQIESVPADEQAAHVSDVSFGGLSFIAQKPFQPGTELFLKIPHLTPPFHTRSRVVWSRPENGSYRIGVQFFEEDDAFRTRMVEQVCAIESYRKEVLQQERRSLTGAEAAHEWIERFAAQFPDPR